MMKKGDIIAYVKSVFNACPGNIISPEDAINVEVAGIKLFEEPIIGIGSAQDELFLKFKEEKIVGPWFMTPEEWMPEAKTVISIFFPFTEEVKESNRKSVKAPSPAWLHGRIEGQSYQNTYMKAFSNLLTEQGIKNIVPSCDARFQKVTAGNNFQEYSCVNHETFSSNWSERHVAYVCGLGTFGLSKGLITEKGMAGRFMSIIIDKEIEVDERPYKGVYDYCTKCGACISRCPAGAISLEHGKNHNICGDWTNHIARICAPRYGCGLCQTKVPCESRIPKTR